MDLKSRLTKIAAVLTVLTVFAGCSASSTSDVASGSTSKKTEKSVSSSAAVSSGETVSSGSSGIDSEKPTVSETASATVSEETKIERYDGTRDPWLWPFAETSIWNMPIGSGAELKKANLEAENTVATDDEIFAKVPAGSPKVNILAPHSDKNYYERWPGGDIIGSMQVPSDFTCADATFTYQPNACSAFLMPDGKTIKQLQPTCRLETGNAPIVGYANKDQDLFGDGLYGSHWGSGLSTLGGSIRLGELTSKEPIKHAIKIDMWAKKYLYMEKTADKYVGYVWPADRHDGYATSGDNAYGGKDPDLRMGTLLTIPKDVTAESLGLKTEVAKKLFYAIQNYGCYVVDDTVGSCYCFCTETGVAQEVRNKYGFSLSTSNKNTSYHKDVMALVQSMYIVTNNGPNSVGGGGTPCKPLAPKFK